MIVRLVIADDHPLILDGLECLLSGREGFEIQARCANGWEALAAVKRFSPDVLLLNLHMPGMDGIAVFDWTITEPTGTGYVVRVWYVDDEGVWLSYGESSPAFAVTDSANNAPSAVDDAFAANEDIILTVAAPGVLGNDGDDDQDQLAATLVATTNHGSLALGANGSFSYAPAAGYTGSDSFTYSADDGQAVSNTATVSITVTSGGGLHLRDHRGHARALGAGFERQVAVLPRRVREDSLTR